MVELIVFDAYNIVMTHPFVLLSILASLPFQTSSGFHVSIGLNEVLDPFIFGEPTDALLAQLQTVDTSVLGSTFLTIDDDEGETQWTIAVRNEVTLVTPRLGNHLLISYVEVEDGHVKSIDLFNPTIRTVSLPSYTLDVNTTNLRFSSTLTIAPLQPLKLHFVEGENAMEISAETLWNETITSITFYQDQDVIDRLDLNTIDMSRYGAIDSSSFHLYRDSKSLDAYVTYDPLTWMHRPLAEEKRTFELAQPTITPLEQAKRWAEFVMYGDGMFAAGRVEEAFRSIEQEYVGMHPTSQQLIFDQPNTKITGINESSQQDTSTFREAVGRYNYLAARVENAQGLQSPVAPTWDVTGIVIPSVGVGSLILLFLFLKQRQRVY